MKYLSFLLIICCISNTCRNNEVIHNLNKDVEELETFPDSLVDHFPSYSDTSYGENCLDVRGAISRKDYKKPEDKKEKIYIYHYGGYIYGHFVSDNIYKKEKQKIDSLKKQIYKGTDSNILYLCGIGKFGEEYIFSPMGGNKRYYGTFDEIVKQNKHVNIDYTLDEELPVPLFEENINLMRGFEDTIQRKELKHYVLGAQKGKTGVFDKKIPERDTCVNYPDSWCNGYSKGVSFYDDKNLIIYWTLTW